MRIPTLLMMSLLQTPCAAAQASQTGAYIVRQGEAEVSRERYRFDGSVLTDTVDLAARGLRLATEMILTESGVPSLYRAAVLNLSGGAEMQRLEVTFVDSAARWTVTGAGAQSGSTPITAPFSMMQNPAFAHLALGLLRLDPTSPETQKLNMWIPEGATVVELVVDWDSPVKGDASLAGVEMEFETDGSGWLRQVEIPGQGVTVEWHQTLDTGPVVRSGRADTIPSEEVLESPYSFSRDGFTLRGTITTPRSTSAAMPIGVIIAGSGSTDRNCNSGTALQTNTYAQIAWRLAERGIATLRYDKRGVGESTGVFDVAATTFDDFAADATAAVRALEADPRFTETVFIGHSEGAAVAVRAVNGGAPVDGVVSMAGMGRPFLNVLRGQLAEQLDDATMVQFDGAMQRFLRGEDPGEVAASLAPFFRTVNRRFTQTIVSYSPLSELADVQVPVLIVQGATDFQTSVTDSQLLSQAKPDARLVVISDANHVFKRSSDLSRRSQTRAYIDPTLPIVSELVEAIAEWISELP